MLSSQHFPAPELDALDASADAALIHKLPNLPLWAGDPIARRYIAVTPSHHILLTDHPSFTSVGLYPNPDGGAGGCIIHQTRILTVLALEFSDDETLGDEWYDTVKHCARWWAAPSDAKLTA